MFTLNIDQDHVQVEGYRLRKRPRDLGSLDIISQEQLFRLAGWAEAPTLHTSHNPAIPDWRLHTTGAEYGDFGSTRVCPPRCQRSALSMNGGLVSIPQKRRCLRMSNKPCVRRRADVVLAVRSSSLHLR